VDESPIQELVTALDTLDADAVMALLGPEPRLLTVDGHRAHGREAVHTLLDEFLASLRACSHEITGQWHQDDTWIAEIEASYELQDSLELTRLPRVLVARIESERIADLRAYGAHEHPLTEHRAGGEGLRIGSRIPPL
jgi:hypothetical protein